MRHVHRSVKQSSKVQEQSRVPKKSSHEKNEVVKVDNPVIALSNQHANLSPAVDQNMKMINDIAHNELSGSLQYLDNIDKIIDVCLKIACAPKKTLDRDKLQAIKIFKDCAEIKYRVLVNSAHRLEDGGTINPL